MWRDIVRDAVRSLRQDRSGSAVAIGLTAVAAAVGLVACWLPARQASEADPLEAMRTE